MSLVMPKATRLVTARRVPKMRGIGLRSVPPVREQGDNEAGSVPCEQLRISIIIPALNEAGSIAATIKRAASPVTKEVIVVDGGSSDGTTDIAASCGAKVYQSSPGRASQMNFGATIATGDILLFLHADTLLPDNFHLDIIKIINQAKAVAGAFRFRLDMPGPVPRLVEFFTNLRSRFWRLPYGDQAIFLSRHNFNRIGGYPQEPILEDVLLVNRLKKIGKIKIASAAVITSGRRWRKLGIIKTTLINQKIMLGYLFGLSPQLLKGWYGIGKKG
jgi:rSAM/selenodomain-associated transferase 2